MSPDAGAPAGARRRPPGRWVGLVLAVTAVVFVVLFVLAVAGAFRVPSRGQHDTLVRERVRTIQVGLAEYAAAHGDRYPSAPEVTADGLSGYVAAWPENPYTGRPMRPGTGPGEYVYTVSPDGRSYTLTGYGSGGPVITLP